MLSSHAGVKSMRRPTRSWRSVQIEQHGFVSSSCSDNLRGLKPLFSLGCSKLLCQLFHFTVSGYCSTVKKATRKYENKMVWLLHETFSNSGGGIEGRNLNLACTVCPSKPRRRVMSWETHVVQKWLSHFDESKNEHGEQTRLQNCLSTHES